MKILIRVDSSYEIGAGHFMRCLSLANALKEASHSVCFSSRTLLPKHKELITEYSHDFLPILISQEFEDECNSTKCLWSEEHQISDAKYCITNSVRVGAEWIIVDHYNLDEIWEKRVASKRRKLMVIDDMANRKHACDALVDYTFNRTEADYKNLVSENCQLYIGSRFSIIKPSIIKAKESRKNSVAAAKVKKIGILMGATDPLGLSVKTLTEINRVPISKDMEKIVILGPGNRSINDLKSAVKLDNIHNVSFLSDPQNYSEVIASLDYAVSACGSTAIELIYLGVPSVLVPAVENQTASAKAFDSAQIARVAWIGAGTDISAIGDEFSKLLSSASNPALNDLLPLTPIFDDLGQKRIVDVLHNGNQILKTAEAPFYLAPIELKDLEMIRSWRNTLEIRRHMYNQAFISKEQHRKWYKKISNDPSEVVLVFYSSGQPCGYVNFKLKGYPSSETVCYWGFYLAPGSKPGLGKQLGSAALSFAFDQLKVEQLIGEVKTENTKSQTFHQKLGFDYIQDKYLDVDGKTLKIKCYTISRQCWLASEQMQESHYGT